MTYFKKLSGDAKNTVQVIALVVVGFFLIASGIFLVTDDASPYTSELSFVERSGDGVSIGSIVPASCESNPATSHFVGDCQCAVTAGPCTGPTCVKTISWNTNYNNAFGSLRLFRNGAVHSTIAVDGSVNETIALGGEVFSVRRPDGQILCSAFVPGPVAPLLTLTATPTVIDPESAADLTWTVSGATVCTASGAWSGSRSITGGTLPVTPASDATYTLVCAGPGGTTTRSASINVNPPLVTLTATPDLIGPGNASMLTWTVVGATTCTGTGGSIASGWNGAKSVSGGTLSVSPINTTSYALSCTGPSGTTARSVTVRLPSGSLSAGACTIPAGATSCNSTVAWNSSNFLGTTQIRRGTSIVSTLSSSPGTPFAVTPTNRTFTLRDSASSFIRTATADAQCITASVWTGAACVLLPLVEVTMARDVVRSGETAVLDVSVMAAYPVQCTLTGGMSVTFLHPGALTPLTYTRTSLPLTSGQITHVVCTAVASPVLTDGQDVLIGVIPKTSEI